jgi:hypothetical protein
LSNGRVVKFADRVREGLSSEIRHADGFEIGGILLGRQDVEQIVVEDFEPVACEHRLGPAYLLCDDDLRGLSESLAWFRSLPADQAHHGLKVLGFYRSQSRPASWHERDEELMRRFFADSGSLLVLLKPEPGEPFDPRIYVWENAALREPGADPPPRAVASAPPALAAIQPRPLERPPLPPFPPRLPTRPRHNEPEEAPDRSWYWVAALVTLTLLAAVLGYRSVGSASPASPTMQQPEAAHQPLAAKPESFPADASKPSPITGAEVSRSLEQSIQAAIEQWQSAMLSGDPDLIAACYAPRLERYLDQPNATSALVRQAALQSFQQYGKPAILRVSGLTVVPMPPDRAIATFRKHYQTAGPRIWAGEDQERLVFVRDGESGTASWRIVSEEETQNYWSEPPRARSSATR